MKPETSEAFLIKELFSRSLKDPIKEVIKLTGDASTRRYYRVLIETKSYVVCLDNPINQKDNDFTFLQKYIHDRGVRVPKIYDKNIKKGYILEEDLGDETLLKQLSSINSVQEELVIYQKIIDILIKLQKIPLGQDDSLLRKRSFTYEKYFSEIQFTLKHFCEFFLKVKDKGALQELENFYREICKNLDKGPSYFCHRDFHSRNIMVSQGEHVVIDFQDARGGIRQYDLVSLLEDSYYCLDQGNKEKLISGYWDEISTDQSYNEFLTTYDYMIMQRVFKAIGSFSYILKIRDDQRYIKFIGYSMEKLKAVFFKYPELSSLRKLLFRYYYDH